MYHRIANNELEASAFALHYTASRGSQVKTASKVTANYDNSQLNSVA